MPHEWWIAVCGGSTSRFRLLIRRMTSTHESRLPGSSFLPSNDCNKCLLTKKLMYARSTPCLAAEVLLSSGQNF